MPKEKINIVQESNDQELVIKLKKKKFPWWIFLFLLPLLLLIKCEKNVTFKVVNINDTVLSNIQSTFSYKRRVLFSNDIITFNDTTNSQGIVTFEGTEYSLYSLIFFGSDTCSFLVENECFATNNTSYNYRSLKEKDIELVKLDLKRKDMQFVMMDEKNTVLPDVIVNITVVNDYSTDNFSDTSDVAGIVEFHNIPACSKITLTSSVYGYHDADKKYESDSVSGKINEVELKPVTKPISFWVKNINTKQPIPYAFAELIVEGTKTGYKIKTNTNGVASVVENGLFEDVHIIKHIKIYATKTDFYDTIYPEPHKKVDDFIKADKEERTIYLRPKAKCVEVKVIDKDSKAALEAAECVINVNGTSTKTEYSNVFGIVQICGLFNEDKISVTASKSGYITNDFTVKDLSVESATGIVEIPLEKEAPPKKIVTVTIKINDYNTAQDDYYDVYYNGAKIGVLENAIGGTTEYSVEAEAGTTIKLTLILTKDMKNGTGAIISATPGTYSENVGGTTDHTFYIPIPK